MLLINNYQALTPQFNFTAPAVSFLASEEIVWTNYYFLLFFVMFYTIFLLISNIYMLNKLTSISNLRYSFLSWMLPGDQILRVLFFFLLMLLTYVSTIYGPSSSIWYSHMIVDSLQIKLITTALILFLIISVMLHTNLVYVNTSSYDLLIVVLGLYLWLSLLFFSSNLFTIIFFLEILSITVMLFNSASLFYNNLSLKKLNFSNNNYFMLNLPFYQTASLMYFFWISFIASVSLFFYLLFFIYYFNTLDIFLLEYLFNFLSSSFSFVDLITFSFIWFGFLFCIFLKCGLVPFYIWKPLFFKGLSYIYIFVYTTFYYFLLLIFFLLFFYLYFFELFTYFIYINIVFLLVGLVTIFSLFLNNTYLKSFFAISSILNTLLVFIALLSYNYLTIPYCY